MPRRESLWARYPDYRVELEQRAQRVRARVGDAVIADSTRTVLLNETRHDPVVYFPREDVRMDRLERTDHESFCPFKGEAAYYTIRTGDAPLENAVWSYEDPFEQAAGLKDYVAFYPDRVTIDRAELDSAD